MKIISKAILRGGFSLPPIVRCRPITVYGIEDWTSLCPWFDSAPNHQKNHSHMVFITLTKD